MMNQDNPYAMNQTCKVCGEPAAGFHFGAFTCEGCKSFFGRSYNNLSSISDCKNNGECIINKKNRTACKACRLRKCLLVGMSKSGSRYGRRSNWFKIHCLLQEQQQQAAAAMAAHHSNQQQHQQAVQKHGAHMLAGPKPSPSSGGIPPPSAAAAALGMLGHAGAYPGLYPPRTKEELIMLGIEEYTKHPAASPSVSSPDSHNSDSSIEVNIRGNPLLHLGGKHVTSESSVTAAMAGTPPQLRKDLPPFLPLPFPGLASMPVMPPPAYLPPTHLLFPGYHPALYQHHQGLLKPSAEQQQAAATAAAVQHLFNTTNATPSRYTPIMTSATHNTPLTKFHDQDEHSTLSPKSDPLNNNHIPNGSKAAEELTKRFYLNAVLQSQRNSPPPTATKLPAHSKHDHSISALVTPNSESGRERFKSRQSNDDLMALGEENEVSDARSDCNNSDCGEDLVVSMTPPRSPSNPRPAELVAEPAPRVVQDNPIDLSMKTGSSIVSSLSSKCSSAGSVQATDSENEHDADVGDEENEQHKVLEMDSEDNNTVVAFRATIHNNNVFSNNNNNNNKCYVQLDGNVENEKNQPAFNTVKRKLDTLTKIDASETNVKLIKLSTMEAVEKMSVKVVTTTPLDLTTKV